MTWLVTFVRWPEARYLIAVEASDPAGARRLGTARLLVSLQGDQEALSDWAWQSTELS